MTNMSSIQWAQMLSFQFDDIHPVLYTILLWALTRVWYSPASVAIFQIAFLSFSIAWGVKVLDENGLPRWASWLVVGLFALSPINGELVITLWKDIPYAAAFLLLSVLALKIVFSNGEWLNHKTTPIIISVVSLFVILMRHNGFPVPLILIFSLFLLYRNHWKALLQALVLTIGVWMIIQFPLFTILKVERNNGIKQHIFLHHIAAHISNGGALSRPEQIILDQIIPLENWSYDCCTVNRTIQSIGFSEEKADENKKAIQKIAASLALKEPKIDIDHMLCSSSIIWSIPAKCEARMFLPISKHQWIAKTIPIASIKENSKLPILVPWLVNLLIEIKENPDFSLMITPALYLLIGLYCIVFSAIRLKELRILLFGVPTITQTAVLLVVNISNEFRYQYPIYLIAIYSIGLVILSLCSPIPFRQKE